MAGSRPLLNAGRPVPDPRRKAIRSTEYDQQAIAPAEDKMMRTTPDPPQPEPQPAPEPEEGDEEEDEGEEEPKPA